MRLDLKVTDPPPETPSERIDDENERDTIRHHFGRISTPPRDLIESLDICGSTLLLCLGELPHDQKRFDAQIRNAASLRVRDNLELAGGSMRLARWFPLFHCPACDGNMGMHGSASLPG
jgi:hypothetical protein